MPLAEALALHEFFLLRQPQSAGELPLHLEAHDPLADRLALAQLAVVCQRFSPTVGLEQAEPRLPAVGHHRIGRAVRRRRGTCGPGGRLVCPAAFTAQVAVADTVGAAWAVAHVGPACRFLLVPAGETQSRVADLPIAALRLPPETLAVLRQLGIESIGELGRLPRSSLHSRFGPQLVRRLDQACGSVEEVIQTGHMPGQFEAQWVFGMPPIGAT